MDKAKVYPPGTHYVVGFDTAARILKPEFYDNSWENLGRALNFLDSQGARFHVLGRTEKTPEGEVFQTYRDIWCPVGKAHLFMGLMGQLDISATALRQDLGPQRLAEG